MTTSTEINFFDALTRDDYYLAPTFYTAVGVVATLVIIIIIMAIGYCCLARYLLKRNRLLNRYTITILLPAIALLMIISYLLPPLNLFTEYYTGK